MDSLIVEVCLHPIFLIGVPPFIFFVWWGIFWWRISIDETGLTKRSSNQFWSWEDFQSGKVSRGDAYYSFVKYDEKKRLRRLSFDGLNEADKKAVLDICLQHWKPPLLSNPPPELTIEYRHFSPRKIRAHLTDQGVDLRSGSKSFFFRWKDVESLRILRLSHLHQNFMELDLRFRDRSVSLKVKHGDGNGPAFSPNWSGASAEDIGFFVLRHVPQDKVTVHARKGPPATLDELEERLVECNRQLRAPYVPFWVRLSFVFVMSVGGMILITMSPRASREWHFLWSVGIGFGVTLFFAYFFAPSFALAREARKRLGEERKHLEHLRSNWDVTPAS